MATAAAGRAGTDCRPPSMVLAVCCQHGCRQGESKFPPMGSFNCRWHLGHTSGQVAFDTAVVFFFSLALDAMFLDVVAGLRIMGHLCNCSLTKSVLCLLSPSRFRLCRTVFPMRRGWDLRHPDRRSQLRCGPVPCVTTPPNISPRSPPGGPSPRVGARPR